MPKYPGGWNTLKNSNPMSILDYIAYAFINTGAVTNGTALWDSDYNVPSGGTWAASPISINAEPQVGAVNQAMFVNELIVADSINMQTKMANLDTDCPPPLQNFVYFYGNSGDLNYQMSIDLDLGASNYDKLQLSILENAATQGNEHGEIEVIDFGSGPYTGVITLGIMFQNRYGPLNIGIRLESTTNDSSLYELKTVILPPNPSK